MKYRRSSSLKFPTSDQFNTNDEISELPNFLYEEIISEILVRLPVKSLLKFRCVSKSWLSLIATPQFVKAHLSISSSYTLGQVLLTTKRPHFSLKQCSALSLMREPLTNVFELDYHPIKSPCQSASIVGSCNGLVCIACDRDLFLWNPSTRISFKLPPVVVKSVSCNMFGFGYNPSNEDYKVVWMSYVFIREGITGWTVNVYSRCTNTWKRIEDIEAGVSLDFSGNFVCVAGKIHFSSRRTLDFNLIWDIGFLDLETEVYGIIEQPNYYDDLLDSFLEILGGCISVLCSYAKTHVDLWVLKEYGVKESWTKVVTIPYWDNPAEFRYSTPLCMLPSGEVLLLCNLHFIVYNPKENRFKHPRLCDLVEVDHVDLYLESLVSPIPPSVGQEDNATDA